MRKLESDVSYTKMAKQAVKARRDNTKFKQMRTVIRTAAAAARKAYVLAARAHPATPDVKEYFQVITPGNHIR